MRCAQDHGSSMDILLLHGTELAARWALFHYLRLCQKMRMSQHLRDFQLRCGWRRSPHFGTLVVYHENGVSEPDAEVLKKGIVGTILTQRRYNPDWPVDGPNIERDWTKEEKPTRREMFENEGRLVLCKVLLNLCVPWTRRTMRDNAVGVRTSSG